MGDQYQREEAHLTWVRVLSEHGLLESLERQADYGLSSSSWIMTGSGYCPLENHRALFLSCGSDDVCGFQVSSGNSYNFLWMSAAFLSALFVKSLSWHPGSWFTMRPACPSFNCMIWHKQKEILCQEREYNAASDFSCQLIRICRVPTRSNEIRKKMQCVWCVSNNCIIYVNRTNEGEVLKQILIIDLKIQGKRSHCL